MGKMPVLRFWAPALGVTGRFEPVVEMAIYFNPRGHTGGFR